jgi:putative transposase
MPGLHHYDNLGTARFVTFSCFHRFQLLREATIIRTFLAELRAIRERGIKIFGYVVMPEHVHLVLLPGDLVRLGVEVGRLKSKSARRMLPMIERVPNMRTDLLHARHDGENRRVFWQRRCHDHNCRTAATVREKIEYCHKNPVTRGLVRDPADWSWSSYRWYAGLPGVELEMDEIEV